MKAKTYDQGTPAKTIRLELERQAIYADDSRAPLCRRTTKTIHVRKRIDATRWSAKVGERLYILATHRDGSATLYTGLGGRPVKYAVLDILDGSLDGFTLR